MEIVDDEQRVTHLRQSPRSGLEQPQGLEGARGGRRTEHRCKPHPLLAGVGQGAKKAESSGEGHLSLGFVTGCGKHAVELVHPSCFGQQARLAAARRAGDKRSLGREVPRRCPRKLREPNEFLRAADERCHSGEPKEFRRVLRTDAGPI